MWIQLAAGSSFYYRRWENGVKEPTWVSSEPMKMRRIRVRSLLAGCISCLRCVRTSGLTCRSSPLASPRTAVLSSRVSLFFCVAFFFSFCLFVSPLSSPAAERDRSVSRYCLCAYSSHVQPVVRASAFALRARTYLSLRRTVVNIWLRTRK